MNPEGKFSKGSSPEEQITLLMQQYLPNNPTMVLALSGGPDSLFLGEMFSQILPKEKLVIAHFNHKLRPSSDEEEEFCLQWAKKKELPFFSQSWEQPEASEEKARHARYAFLEQIMRQKKADAIALGHHQDDQAETIFFQFLRGSGLRGLRGMQPWEAKTKRFRPLLPFQKEEILEFLRNKSIEYCLDESNAESDYTRNFLRNDIFPILEEKFPTFKKTITRQSALFARIEDFSQVALEDFLQKHSTFTPPCEGGLGGFEKMEKSMSKTRSSKEYRIDRAAFLERHPYLQGAILRHLFQPKSLSFEQVEELREFLEEAKSGKKKIFKNITISVSQTTVCLKRSPC